MSRAFAALLWKERREVGKALWIAPICAAVLFYEWVPKVTADGLTNPITPMKWGLFFLIGLASTVGYQQTVRESGRDMWTFAIHRPVTPNEIFAAKLIVCVAPLLVFMIIPGTLAMWVVSAARELPPSARWAYWPAAVADALSILGYYGAGLNLGAPGGRGARGSLGMGVALLGTCIVVFSQESRSVIGIAVSVALTLVVMAMAWLGFTNGAEFEAEDLKAVAGVRS
jgi:hypothetical protein